MLDNVLYFTIDAIHYTDPCVTEATKVAQALGCLVLKPEHTQVITGVLRGRSVFAILQKDAVLHSPTRCFDIIHPGSLPLLSPLQTS